MSNICIVGIPKFPVLLGLPHKNISVLWEFPAVLGIPYKNISFPTLAFFDIITSLRNITLIYHHYLTQEHCLNFTSLPHSGTLI